MTSGEFQTECLSRWQDLQYAPRHQQEIEVLALAICGEAGELANFIKKWRYGKQLDVDDIASEVGDVLFYVSVLAHLFGLTLDEVMAANVAKLRERHGEEFDRNHYTGDTGPGGGALASVPTYTPKTCSKSGNTYRDFG